MDALSTIEIRVLGCLLEKAVTTPDQYPLTLNAIITASNQKSSREPVMSLAQGEVQRALRLLEDKLLVGTEPNLRGRVEKYAQRFCKTPFGMYELDTGQYAVLTVLMLRGPQTPGELKTRCERMHPFASPAAVEDTLVSLRDWEGGALVAEQPREPNRRDACWAQLFGEDAAAYREAATPTAATSTRAAPDPAPAATPVTKPPPQAPSGKSGTGLDRLATLEARVDSLELALDKLQHYLL